MDNEESPLGRMITKIIESLGDKGKLGEEEIMSAWQNAVGKQAASHSRPVSFKRATLIVNVDGSSWLYELSTRKKETLKKLDKGLAGKKVKDIRFRIGDTAGRR